MDNLESRGIDTSRLYVSERAHLIMPYHILLDQLEERARGSAALGTTGRGVGPAYTDKTGRMGIRAGELFDLSSEDFLPRLKRTIEFKNNVITKVYGEPPVSLEEVYDKCLNWSQRLKHHIRPTELMVHKTLSQGHNVLLEGAQGTLAGPGPWNVPLRDLIFAIYRRGRDRNGPESARYYQHHGSLQGLLHTGGQRAYGVGNAR